MKNKYLDPKNYFRKAGFIKDRLLYWPLYNREKFEEEELNKFSKYNFDFNKAKEEINDILNDLGKNPIDSQDGMGSVHWVLFSCIKQVSEIKNILELGTYDGETSLVLSRLFPDSKITTVDLPEDDPIFLGSYGRQDNKIKDMFNSTRDQNLSNKNIKYIERNSLFLLEEISGEFDLVWVDAGHLYPEISWDIANGYQLCRNSGWILCDDIIPHKRGLRDELVSPDSYHIWEYLNERTYAEVDYFLKRRHPRFSANPKKRKYVSLLRKEVKN